VLAERAGVPHERQAVRIVTSASGIECTRADLVSIEARAAPHHHPAGAGGQDFRRVRGLGFATLTAGSRIGHNPGAVIDLGPGDLASLPPGVATTWHITLPYQAMWAFAPGEP
jgi:hypothetical protein